MTDTTRLPRALKPFATAQYRILAIALTLSLFGAGVWIIAMVLQVRALGGGPIELSYVATGSAIGMLLAVLFGGVAADRIPQKYILVGIELTKTVLIGVVAALAYAGVLEIWHLAIAAFIIGVAEGFFYPAYTAMLPSILKPDDLLAANGFEGVLRPVVMMAAGPAVAAAVVATTSPAVAFTVVVIAQVLALAVLLVLKVQAVRREFDEKTSPVKALFGDIGGGFAYMFRTPWLLATLLFASLLILLIMGPIEVLLPFAVFDQTSPIFGWTIGANLSIALGAFGVGGAIGSAVIASLRLPRRYLTLMNLLWGAGCIPLVVIGFTSELWLMVVALFVCGFAFSAANVIWGTLLQRRVPPQLLGRVSSLDFFVSLVFMPVSMAIAGPVGESIGTPAAFVIAGAVPVVLAVVAILAWRLPRDEIEHPLDGPAAEIDGPFEQPAPTAAQEPAATKG
jgi:MFS family permease